MTDAAIPQRIGRYRIEGILGQGASAVVYAGFDPGIQRHVAVKCLHGEVASDPGYRRRFVVEARAAGQLTHPHIVTIFDAGETADRRPYIAMERLSGETLSGRVASEGLPPVPVIIELAAQLASALDYAHASGVTHHDIKPENIMLVDAWQHAKISDFGIAERRGAPPSDASARYREIGGTPAFMASERLRGDPSDARSDLFSLGVVLFWLVTGDLPWPVTDDVSELLRARQAVPLPPIQPRDPSTPSILVAIVRTLLEPRPSARYQHGSEVVEDLRLARREYERLGERPLARRIVSLRLRWAGALGIILSLVLMVGLAAIYARQRTAVAGLAGDYGGSLGRMIAAEAAENLLLGDHAATRALVQDIARNRQIHYLAIADRHGAVIASTRGDEVGRAMPAPGRYAQRPRFGPSPVAGRASEGDMLLFDEPIRYQDTRVGELRLGISDAQLKAVQHTTFRVIIAVLGVTLLAVVAAAYALFRRPLILLDLLGDAMLRVARGEFQHRIRLHRRDEIGRLFATFNLMSSALQDHQRPVADRPEADADAVVQAIQPTRVMHEAPHASRDE